MRGFQKTGISPFNPDVFTNDFIAACDVSSSGSSVESFVEQPGPSNGQTTTTVVLNFPPRSLLPITLYVNLMDLIPVFGKTVIS
jgi:hypothetical protein